VQPKNPLKCPYCIIMRGGIVVGPTLFFYELVLIALVWLFLLLHYTWPNTRT
jgi:hypothetical protein